MRNTLLVALALPLLMGASPKTYTSDGGKVVRFPLGDLSFADEVVSFEAAKAADNKKGAKRLEKESGRSLGPPDHDRRNKKIQTTMGCGGVLTLRFKDNALVDVEGPDLFVFEIGRDVEPTSLAISADGEKWIEVGKIGGGIAEVDIAGFVEPDRPYSYVRLTDLKSACRSQYPGADIDAVGAIGAGVKISLSSAVLFDVDKAVIKPAAETDLAAAAKQLREYPGARVVIGGHTDSTGKAKHNQDLSERRAEAVRKRLASDLTGAKVEVRGYGATRPIASNDSDKGREKNRRVEIIVIPNADE